MFKKKGTSAIGRQGADGSDSYPLGWPSSQRWNPRYNVPRNSLDTLPSSDPFHPKTENGHAGTEHQPRSMSYGRSTRDMDTFAGGAHHGQHHQAPDVDEFSSLALWLDALAELYMNNLDNRARRDPRWLNITRRERFEGLASASVTVVDYLAGDTVRRGDPITTKAALADALQTRPAAADVRVLMVSDLSRFVMGALGQLYAVDADFWLEHLANAGYAASDSGLKLKNAAWLNWAERETRFRHRALPEAGQPTEWNLPRRTRARRWTHLRWGRLGLLNYLGRKGFFEDEMDIRLGDGRWVTERDVELDKRGVLMTHKRRSKAEKKAKREEKKKKERKHSPPSKEDDGISMRCKTSNIYRAYSTFESLPKNPMYWRNRDLRVMAPEGMSYWSGADADGKKTIILLFDPARNMKHQRTKEVTPSLTFMPRAMELESYTDEELWRTPDLDETYLDPPPLRLSKKELKKQKEAARDQKRVEEIRRRKKAARKDDADDDESEAHESNFDHDSASSDTSDSDYDEAYQKELYAEYKNPRPYTRDRDFARKYALPTHELVYRYMSTMTTSEILHDDSLLPSVLTRLVLDDVWRLTAEIRLNLDYIDDDLGADFHLHLLESIGTTTRLRLGWMRSTLQELHDWAAHLAAGTPFLDRPADLVAELATLDADLLALQARARDTLSFVTNLTGLAQSSLVVDQTSGINKLTELAFFFIPLSFITSVFSMQVLEITTTPPHIWVWGVCLAVVFLTTYVIRCTLRSPSMRIFAMQARVTILNRFTSSSSRSASRRLNSVGNRAIAKYVLFVVGMLLLIFFVLLLALVADVLVSGGIWFGAAATALYFIITRWPEPAVLVPCFIALLLAAGAMWALYHWRAEIRAVTNDFGERWANAVFGLLPSNLILDAVDDEDLAKEGINTYARQAMSLATP